MKVSINIVTWNSLKFLPDCLKSIFDQTYFRNISFPYRKQGSERSEGSYKDFSVLVIDNGSNDGTLDYLKENYPEIKILRNNKNLGFAAAHNQGIKLSQSYDYVFVVNPDIILEDDWLEKILTVAEKDKKIGAIGGKLIKIYTSDLELGEKVKTKMIDSAGLKIFRSRRVVDRGEGEIDQSQYDKNEEVFSLSGACVLYRISALEDIKIPTNYEKFTKLRKENSDGRIRIAEAKGGGALFGCEYFDEDFFSYKEDIDLGWRLRLYGWKIIYYPQAIAYHYRRIFGGKNKIGEIIKRRKEKSPLINYLSYRNHLFCLIKNDFLVNFFKDLPFILFYELKKFLYLLLFEQRTLKIILDIFKNLSKMLQKRRHIMKNKKINPRKMKKWFF